MTDILLPCPFCGGEVQVSNNAATELGDEGAKAYAETGAEVYWVECGMCNAYVAKDTKTEAVTAWNRRTPLQVEPHCCGNCRHWERDKPHAKNAKLKYCNNKEFYTDKSVVCLEWEDIS